MAALRARALAVAAGVPAAFVLVATVLGFGTAGSPATAAEPAAEPASVAVPFSVTRDLVRPTGPGVPVSFRVAAAKDQPALDPKVVFITIDDGVTKDMRGLRYVERWHLPVTAFLSTWTVKDRAPYFARITRWGSVQNHSATHASMARSTTDLDHEICYAQRALTKDFGSTPWILRPPYGAGPTRMEVQVTAERCGIQHVVLWDAVVQNGRLAEVGNGLRPGSVILLHFTPDLEKDLKAAVRAARKAGLRPADLAAYLPRSAASA